MSAAILDRPGFILAHTRVRPTPLAPEIRLHVADEATELWRKTEEQLGEIGLPPPYWAFAWAGGQALARHLLDHRALVAGRRVLDFASGSGLVAIAAALAGAASVEASEIDDFACAAIALNAARNGAAVRVRRGDLIGADEGWEVVLAGDVSYQADMAEAVTAWLAGLARRGATVLIGDPWRSYLARDLLEPIAEFSVPVTRALEDAEIKRTAVFRFRGAAGPAAIDGARAAHNVGPARGPSGAAGRPS
jgi:predicted nicotinamide N-methyase